MEHEHHHHTEPNGKVQTINEVTPAQQHAHHIHPQPKAAAGHQLHHHDKHAGHHTEDFLKRFWICLGLTVPVLLLSKMIQHWLGFSISLAGDNYMLLLLGSIIYFYGGLPFLKEWQVKSGIRLLA